MVGVGFFSGRASGRVTLSRGAKMTNFGGEIVYVLIVAVVILEFEGKSRHHPTGSARPRHDHVAGLFFLHVDLGNGVTLVLRCMKSGIIEQFQRLARGEADDSRFIGQEAGRWSREIVIADAVLAGL